MRQEAEPATDEVTEVAPGVLRMQLPIDMPGLGHVNTYALVDAEGVALVDPGVPGEASWNALLVRLKKAGIPLDHVAVVVQPLDTDKPLISHNADAALNPASVMKLVTNFAALNQLGPNYVWKTDVWAEGPIRDGVLEGDLVIADGAFRSGPYLPGGPGCEELHAAGAGSLTGRPPSSRDTTSGTTRRPPRWAGPRDRRTG